MHASRTAFKVAVALASLWLFSQYIQALLRDTPWDFETYYYAAKAAEQSLNPYDNENLSELARRPVTMPYVYPPATVLLFTPFTRLPTPTADLVWRMCMSALLVLLLLIWLLRFLRRNDPLLLSIALALGFNTTALWGLRVGNIAILEAVFLWAAFAFYVDGRRIWFTALVVLVSVFKIVPVLFLGLLLVSSPTSPSRPWLALGGLAVLAACVLMPVWLGPPWAQTYFHHLPSVRQTGVANPCALGFFDTILGSGSGEPIAHVRQQLNPALALWSAYAVALAAFSLPAIRRSWVNSDSRQLVFECTYLFVLLSPRPMIYSYLLLIPLVLAFGEAFFRKVGGSVLVVAVLILPAIGRRFGFVTRDLFWDNYPFFVALAIWLMYVWQRGRRAAVSGATHGPTKGGRQAHVSQSSRAGRAHPSPESR